MTTIIILLLQTSTAVQSCRLINNTKDKFAHTFVPRTYVHLACDLSHVYLNALLGNVVQTAYHKGQLCLICQKKFTRPDQTQSL